MGICGSADKGDTSQQTTSKPHDDGPKAKGDVNKDNKIQESLDKKAVSDAQVLKLLLLGPGESGKSTLFKQIQTIYGEGFKLDQLKQATPQVHNNTMLCLKALADNCLQYTATGGELQEENEDIVEYLQSLVGTDIENAQIDTQYIEQYKRLWADPLIKETWKHRSEYQIYGCAEYLIERIDAICAKDYVPSLEDLLQIRVRTTGIVESLFKVQDTSMKLVDVGGQRNERRKWIHCFEGVTAVIFVAAISEFDQKLFEDAAVNRLDEALILFEEVCNTEFFLNTPILLFLNKRDLFDEKILRVPLSQYQPGFPGPDHDSIAASDWIAEQFRLKNTSGRNKIVYCMVTTAVDRTIVHDLFISVKDIVVREALAKTGLV